MSTHRSIVSCPLLLFGLVLGCASAPPPAPAEPGSEPMTPASPASAEPSGPGGPIAPPPLASEPPLATAPPVGVAADPSPVPTGARPGAAPADRVPAVDPGRPVAASAPSSARASTTGARGATRPAGGAPTSASTVPAGAAGASYNGPDPCKLAVDGDSPVDKACREGGLRAAKTAMKTLLKDARNGGLRFDCDDCHINEEDYAQLAQGTDEKFAKLLAAARK
jgi:hypothetical protein